jgi:hypothetical protein
MPVFISYSHQDKEFVEKLAAHLVKNNAHVWVDTWELNVGDSIIFKVQEAIQSASALLVVLSNASVQSEWCKKELSAGLMRELEEKKVLVLPIRLDDCEIPLFLREKMYADFRTNFDVGLKAVVESIARVTNSNQGRIVEPEFHIDFAVDWGYRGELFELNFTLVEQAVNLPFTVLTQVRVTCNERATARYKQYMGLSLDWLGRLFIAESLSSITENSDLRVILNDQFPKERNAKILDKKTGLGFDVFIVSRRLGEDTGKDILLNVRGQLDNIRSFMKERTRAPNEHEKYKLLQLLRMPFGA